MNIAVIIPARGQSKEIPNKNIYPLNGKPLLAYTIEAAFESGITKHIFVSTDSAAVAQVARKFGAEVINRSKDISSDTAPTETALIHALEVMEKEKGLIPDLILTLPPTSPLRSAKTIRNSVDYYLSVASKYDAMITLTETRGDYWIKDSRGEFKRIFPDAPRRRQERDPVYIENSALYITQTKSLLKTQSILGTFCTGFVIDEKEAIDINTENDLWLAEMFLKRRASE